MLPDLPEIKLEIHTLLMNLLQRRILAHSGFLGGIPQVAIPEGSTSKLLRSDGTSDKLEMKKVESQIRMPITPNGPSREEVLKMIDKAAEDFAKQQTALMVEKIDAVTQETGNVFDARGQGITARLLNDMLEKLQIPFDENGMPIMPSFVCHPDNLKALLAKKEEIEGDAAEKARYEEIIIRKREEHRDREGNRRLAE
jgi:hypothetical protein